MFSFNSLLKFITVATLAFSTITVMLTAAGFCFRCGSAQDDLTPAAAAADRGRKRRRLGDHLIPTPIQPGLQSGSTGVSLNPA
ncbi:MAG: hypothetical protein JO279_18725 [Verrucomicrobia bacterium]|nr:hypothetical protein [Verrucomicrobiota bacterium]